MIGYLAALPAIYYKNIEKEKEREQEIPSEWVGEPKQRLEDDAECIFYKTYESPYGLKSIVKFVSNNNILTWFASGEPEFNPGETYRIKYTVKDHDEYRGKKQTIVNRVKSV